LKSFCHEHKIDNIQKAIELFSIFGGVEWGEIDLAVKPFDLVKKLILDDYTFIRNDISITTTGLPLYHSILSAIALGDGRVHSALKHANVNIEVGTKAIDELLKIGIITKEKPRVKSKNDYNVSNKLHFNTPFMRFWFAFVSPIFKGIKEGDYKEIEDRFNKRISEFEGYIFEQLSQEFLKTSFVDDAIVENGNYWDKDTEIDIYAKSRSKKVIVGSCRYTNSKIKKSELTKLQEKAQEAGIKADIFVLFAKNGFSSELKSLKSDALRLYTLKSFKSLL